MPMTEPYTINVYSGMIVYAYSVTYREILFKKKLIILLLTWVNMCRKDY